MHAVMGPSLTARRIMVRRACYRGMMAGLVAVGLWHGPALAAPPVGMAAHRAVYDLVLSAVGDGDVVTAEGRLTFVLSDMCTAWSTQQQLHVRSVSREGDEHDSDSDYAVLEDKDGSSLIFRADQSENGQASPRIAGEAHMSPGGGRVHYTAPGVHDVALPAGTLFPVAHTASVIAAGQAAQTEIAPPLFDGTVETGALNTYVLLLAREAPPVATPFAALAPLGAQRVHIAYYNPTTRDMGPIFEQGMRYFTNGVADRLDLDFGQFRLAGTLREFRLLPVPDHCPATPPLSPPRRPL